MTPPVGIGTSLFLIAVGAILRYAVTATVSGIDLQVVGLILMIIGIIGLLLAFVFLFMGNRAPRARPDDPTVVRDRDRY